MKKVSIGEVLKIKDRWHTVEELFVAEGIRWVRTVIIRKKYNVTYNGKKYRHYDVENRYFSEMEWIRHRRTALL